LSWQRLCAAQDIEAGRLTGVEIQGAKVLVTRIDGNFVAFPPLCPHMAEPLEISGVCSEGMLTCTKHIWQWELSTGAPRGDAEKPLLYYPVRIEGNELWIDFDRELGYEYDD
jgi:toluene monooxygenase system ferredoxin subunit